MDYFGFYLNPDSCIGCKACQLACKEYHNIYPGYYFRRVDTVRLDSRWLHWSDSCHHCTQPGCLKACPANAIFKAADGSIQLLSDHCIGCGACVYACPYGAIYLDPNSGRAAKCDSCTDRRADGKNPVCVDACPTRALQFGPVAESPSVPVFQINLQKGTANHDT